MPGRLPGLGCWGKHFRNARETARTGILGRQNFYETLKTKETARTGVHAVWSTRVTQICFSTGKTLIFPKIFSVVM